MSWLRRREETLNEKLVRESGYAQEGATAETAVADEQPEPESEPESEPLVGSRAPSSRGVSARLGTGSGANRWAWESHVVATVELPELQGEDYAFTTLPDGSIIVDDTCEDDLSRLADAVEEHLAPPYRAAAVRHGNGFWAVSARPIEVAAVVSDGDEVELTSLAGVRIYTVDGRKVDGSLAPAELAALGEARSADSSVHAVRLDGDLWEVEVNPL